MRTESILVTGIHQNTSARAVKEYFERFGRVRECELVTSTFSKVEDQLFDQVERTPAVVEPPAKRKWRDRDAEDNFYDYVEPTVNYKDEIAKFQAFLEKFKKECTGKALVLFFESNASSECMKQKTHNIDGAVCSIEWAAETQVLKTDTKSKKICLTFWPLRELSMTEIRVQLAVCGDIKKIEMVENPGYLNGFCIVTFASAEAANKACRKQFKLRGVTLSVKKLIKQPKDDVAKQQNSNLTNTQERAQNTYRNTPSNDLQRPRNTNNRERDNHRDHQQSLRNNCIDHDINSRGLTFSNNQRRNYENRVSSHNCRENQRNTSNRTYDNSRFAPYDRAQSSSRTNNRSDLQVFNFAALVPLPAESPIFDPSIAARYDRSYGNTPRSSRNDDKIDLWAGYGFPKKK